MRAKKEKSPQFCAIAAFMGKGRPQNLKFGQIVATLHHQLTRFQRQLNIQTHQNSEMYHNKYIHIPGRNSTKLFRFISVKYSAIKQKVI